MNKQNQNGSMHLILSVIVVILLVAVLGFLFWQNFIKKGEEQKAIGETSKTTISKDKSPKAEKLTKDYTIPKENLAFKYPDTWRTFALHTNTKSDEGENRVMIVSSNNFALQVGIPSNGPSWQFGERPLSCPFNEGYSGFQGGDDNHPDVCPFYTELMSQNITNLSGLSIMAFETTWESTQNLPTIDTLYLVKSGCKIPENELCERPAAKSGYYLDIQGSYYKSISEEDKKNAYINSGYDNQNSPGAKEFIKSQDVITAIAIIKSMKYTK